MKKEIDWIKKTRIYLLDLLKDLTVEQLNNIPTGFNNNIIWNLGHLIISQQGLCYSKSGLDMRVDEGFFTNFRSQSKPVQFISEKEIDAIKELLLSTINILENDYEQKVFKQYAAYTTRYDVKLENIDDAIDFLIFHEGLHAGYIMAMKRIVQ